MGLASRGEAAFGAATFFFAAGRRWVFVSGIDFTTFGNWVPYMISREPISPPLVKAGSAGRLSPLIGTLWQRGEGGIRRNPSCWRADYVAIQAPRVANADLS